MFIPARIVVMRNMHKTREFALRSFLRRTVSGSSLRTRVQLGAFHRAQESEMVTEAIRAVRTDGNLEENVTSGGAFDTNLLFG